MEKAIDLVKKFNWMFFVLFGLTVVEVQAAVFTTGPEVGAGTTGLGERPEARNAMSAAERMLVGARDRGGDRGRLAGVGR